MTTGFCFVLFFWRAYCVLSSSSEFILLNSHTVGVECVMFIVWIRALSIEKLRKVIEDHTAGEWGAGVHPNLLALEPTLTSPYCQ